MKINFQCDDPSLMQAFALAISDLYSNIKKIKCGLLRESVCVLLPGAQYPTQWSRDAAINVMNAVFCLDQEVARNTLLSALEEKHGEPIIGGQYWDNIIWSIAAWRYYQSTLDKDFFNIFTAATSNTLRQREADEFNSDRYLFRGPACYGDGVSAYPDIYSCSDPTKDRYLSSSILDLVLNKPSIRFPIGAGIPFYSLSTNCLYYYVYKILENLKLHRKVNSKNIAAAIENEFWDPEAQTYNYIVDHNERYQYSEPLGKSFAILFGLTDTKRSHHLISSEKQTASGVPCLWPPFERYRIDTESYGRHSATVWPHIQGFWGLAALKAGCPELFHRQLKIMANNAISNGGFFEVYHPNTAAPYGGIQENGKANGQQLWPSGERQTWSATAFLALITYGLFGLEINHELDELHRNLLPGYSHLQIEGLQFRGKKLKISKM